MKGARQYAKETLIHYFKLCGVMKDADNMAEIDNVIDAIIEAAAEEAVERINKKKEESK
jgi:hypothetical protein